MGGEANLFLLPKIRKSHVQARPILADAKTKPRNDLRLIPACKEAPQAVRAQGPTSKGSPAPDQQAAGCERFASVRSCDPNTTVIQMCKLDQGCVVSVEMLVIHVVYPFKLALITHKKSKTTHTFDLSTKLQNVIDYNA